MYALKASRFIFKLSLFALASCAGLPTHPSELAKQNLEFELQMPEEVVLENGLIVYYGYDPELPLMGGTLYLPGGTLFDPADITGLASATGSQMREGGVQGVSPDDLDDRLDSIGAAVEAGFSTEYGSAGFSCLSDDIEEVFSLFRRVVLEPSFDSKRLELWKRMALEGIRRRRDDPHTMAQLAFRNLVFGDDNAYSRLVSEESLKRITKRELQGFHRRFVRPNGARLAMAGSLPREKALELIKRNFGAWKPVEEPLPPFPELSPPKAPGVYVLKRDFNQATVVMGHRGPPRHTNDRYAINVYNQIFGFSGFSSVLFQEIRTKLGLAYSVWGGLAPGNRAGTFRVGLATRADQALQALKRTQELVRESTESSYSKEQVSDSITNVSKSFVFKFQSPGAVADRTALLATLGFPKNYDKTYVQNLRKVDLEAVHAVPKRWVKPEQLTTVIVGDIEISDVVEAFGEETSVFELEFKTEPRVLRKVS